MWNDYALARGLHVLAVLMWIGGVGLVTTVLIPAIRREAPVGQAYARFQAIEHRFAAQARGWVLLAGVSGAWMLHTTASWGRLANTGWLHAMLAVWGVFFMMLFVLEPLLMHRILAAKAQRDDAGTMRLLARMHWVLLTASLVTTLLGVVGAHGGWRLGA